VIYLRATSPAIALMFACDFHKKVWPCSPCCQC